MIELLDYRLHKKKLLTPGEQVTAELKQTPLFEQNLEEMKKILAKDGVGLAATQVNWPIQLFMLCIDAQDNKIEPEIFINPKITSFSKKKVRMEEGCLSFPYLYIKIARPESIEWEYEDLSGVKHQATASGFYARAIQHEIDHLNGKVFIHQASAVQQMKVRKWLKS